MDGMIEHQNFEGRKFMSILCWEAKKTEERESLYKGILDNFILYVRHLYPINNQIDRPR